MTKSIALIGFYGSGKTSLGHRVAYELGLPFSDMYSEIEKLGGMKVAPLYERMGEAAFRQFESLALSSLAASGGVTATTGGCVMMAYNRRVLSESFLTFCLDAPFSFVAERADSAARPTIRGLTTDELRRLYEMRRPMYIDIADEVFDATLPHDKLKNLIVNSALAEV
jgi:shikimate kinase